LILKCMIETTVFVSVSGPNLNIISYKLPSDRLSLCRRSGNR
jgi:hypothetical protein